MPHRTGLSRCMRTSVTIRCNDVAANPPAIRSCSHTTLDHWRSERLKNYSVVWNYFASDARTGRAAATFPWGADARVSGERRTVSGRQILPTLDTRERCRPMRFSTAPHRSSVLIAASGTRRIAIHAEGTDYALRMRYFICRGFRYYAGQVGYPSRHRSRQTVVTRPAAE